MSVDANTASREDLIALVGLGKHKADEIIRSRPFDSIDDLLRIPGFGERVLERLVRQGLAVASRPVKESNMESEEMDAPASDASSSEDDGRSESLGEMGATVDEPMGRAVVEAMSSGVDEEMAIELEEEMASPLSGEMEMIPPDEFRFMSAQDIGMAIAEGVQAVELSGKWKLTFSVHSLKSSESS